MVEFDRDCREMDREVVKHRREERAGDRADRLDDDIPRKPNALSFSHQLHLIEDTLRLFEEELALKGEAHSAAVSEQELYAEPPLELGNPGRNHAWRQSCSPCRICKAAAFRDGHEHSQIVQQLHSYEGYNERRRLQM